MSTSSVAAAGFQQQLAAAAARQQRLAVTGDDGHGQQRALSARCGQSSGAGRVQSADQAALGAQGQAVGGVLHVAAGEDLPVGGLPGRTDPKPGVRSVGPSRCGHGGGAKPGQSMITQAV